MRKSLFNYLCHSNSDYGIYLFQTQTCLARSHHDCHINANHPFCTCLRWWQTAPTDQSDRYHWHHTLPVRFLFKYLVRIYEASLETESNK